MDSKDLIGPHTVRLGARPRLRPRNRRLDPAGTVGNVRTMRDEKPDLVEIWGRRVGRALGAIAAIGLLAYLLATYGPA